MALPFIFPNFILHTFIYTLATSEGILHFVPVSLGLKCELRDVIYAFTVI